MAIVIWSCAFANLRCCFCRFTINYCLLCHATNFTMSWALRCTPYLARCFQLLSDRRMNASKACIQAWSVDLDQLFFHAASYDSGLGASHPLILLQQCVPKMPSRVLMPHQDCSVQKGIVVIYTYWHATLFVSICRGPNISILVPHYRTECKDRRLIK